MKKLIENHVEEENCYNCGYSETFENSVIRCFHIPKGGIKPCPYFIRKVSVLEDGTIMPVPAKEKWFEPSPYRGIEDFHGNV